MDIGLLEKLLGGDRSWSLGCTVIVDTNAVVRTSGQDAIATGGMKTYAPRYSSGRIDADAVLFLKEFSAVVVLQQRKHKDSTGAESLLQTLTFIDPSHIVAVEYAHAQPLKNFDLTAPPIRSEGYRADMVVG